MSDIRAFQPAFTAGELSPALWARVDLAKYTSGMKTGRNLFIHPHGGASNRAGTEFIREVKDSTKITRLIPFEFNTEQTYTLEFGHLYMRVFKNGAIVLLGGVPFELVTPFPQEVLADLVVTQENDVAYITHPLYAVQKLSRLADNNWVIGTVTFVPSINPPTGLTGQAYFKLRKGDVETVVYAVAAIGAGGQRSAITAGLAVNVQYEVDDGRKVRLNWTASPGAVAYRVYRVGGANQGFLAETPNPGIDISQTTIIGDGVAPPGAPDPGAPPTPGGYSGGLLFGDETSYVVSAVNEASGEESLPSAPATVRNALQYAGNKNILTWNPVAGSSGYIVYRESNGVYGYVGRAEGTTFEDENITPDVADSPQTGENPFLGAGNYPRCSAIIEQRLSFAGTHNNPQGVWMSQSANYENFGKSSPAKASDAVTFRIRAKRSDEVRALLELKGLMLLTSGSEWIIHGGSQSDAITPSAIKRDNQGHRGAARVQPVVVGETVLFAQNRGGVVRDFSYQITADGFTGRDLTILARHLFEDRTIKAWAFQQAPYSIVWAVLDNGSLVSLTYQREHEVWAWTHHKSGPNDEAKFEDVACVAEGEEDAVYFIVRRTVNGVAKRYIERLHSRKFTDVEDAFFVDCGLTYSGSAATVMSGLGHLEGQQVVALANGNVVRNLTVTGGSVTLPNPTTKAHIGLPVVAALQTLDLDLGQVNGLGTVQGRSKSVSEVTLRVQDTRGIFLGPKDGGRDDQDIMVEYKQRAGEAWNEAIRLHTGDIRITPMWDWSDGGNLWIKQFDPLPMTILAVMPDVTIGR